MKTNAKEVSTNHNEYFEQRESAMLALDYIVQSLRQSNVDDIATALTDIIHIYNNIEDHTKGCDNPLEYQDILYMYLVVKYHSKITLDKYKAQAMDLIISQSSKNHG